jgi:hypothetical protein
VASPASQRFAALADDETLAPRGPRPDPERLVGHDQSIDDVAGDLDRTRDVTRETPTHDYAAIAAWNGAE